jgi:hypothetical protein
MVPASSDLTQALTLAEPTASALVSRIALPMTSTRSASNFALRPRMIDPELRLALHERVQIITIAKAS